LTGFIPTVSTPVDPPGTIYAGSTLHWRVCVDGVANPPVVRTVRIEGLPALAFTDIPFSVDIPADATCADFDVTIDPKFSGSFTITAIINKDSKESLPIAVAALAPKRRHTP